MNKRMKSPKKRGYNFQKDNLINPKRFDMYGTSISNKIWWLVIELDRMEQVQKLHVRRNKQYACDRAINMAAANAYNHAFELVCEIFDLSPDEEFDLKRGRGKAKMGGRKLKLYRNEDWLKEKWEGERLSTNEIANICNVNQVTINSYLNKFGLK